MWSNIEGMYSYDDVVRMSRRFEIQTNAKRIGNIAVLDTGVHPHGDLRGRIIDIKDMVEGKESAYDDHGHGTHICGIMAGSGNYCNGKIKGISARCSIVSVKVLDKTGNGKIDKVLKGFDYVIKNKDKFNIRVVNISMGAEVVCGDKEMEMLINGVERMWEKGLIVMAAGGNNGPKEKSITAPGNSKKIITVGSCDDDKRMMKNRNYSGRGPTCDCVIKPDIVTVGSNIMGLNNVRNGYILRSGTSMATAVASAVVAVFLQKYTDYTSKDVKKLLINTAIDMGKNVEVQGNGLMNIYDVLS